MLRSKNNSLGFQTVGPLIAALLSCSCSSSFHGGGSSPYGGDYQAALSHFQVPNAAQVKQAGIHWTFNKPPQATWDASLHVLSQYAAILSITQNGNEHVAVVMASSNVEQAAENSHRNCVFTEFHESWVAVAVRPTADRSRSELSVARIMPNGELIGANRPECDVVVSAVQTEMSAENNWPWLVNAKLPNPPAQVADFHVSATSAADAELMNKISAWVSKKFRSDMIAVTSPDTTAVIDAILDRLKAAAGQPDLKLQTHLVASPAMTAFVMPNGDVYVTTGLLDAMETADQVAAVLSRELIHKLNNDALNRLRARVMGNFGSNALQLTLMSAAMASQFVVSNNPSIQLVQAFASQTAQAVGNAGRNYLENEMVTDFDADVEMAADEQGLQLLSAAGFDPGASVAMLEKLQAKAKEVGRSNVAVVSNVLNTKAKVEDREQRLRADEAKYTAKN